jgi:hypothetical protein
VYKTWQPSDQSLSAAINVNAIMGIKQASRYVLLFPPLELWVINYPVPVKYNSNHNAPSFKRCFNVALASHMVSIRFPDKFCVHVLILLYFEHIPSQHIILCYVHDTDHQVFHYATFSIPQWFLDHQSDTEHRKQNV